MKVSWRNNSGRATSLRAWALGGGVVLGAMVGAACTVTSGTGDDDAGLFSDSGTGSDTSTGGDSGGGGDTGTTCAARNEVLADGGGGGAFGFPDNGGQAAGACDTCMDTNCCSQVGACFQDPTDQCQGLEDCLTSCIGIDEDGGCSQTCADGYGNAPTDLHNAWGSCGHDNCATECGF